MSVYSRLLWKMLLGTILAYILTVLSVDAAASPDSQTDQKDLTDQTDRNQCEHLSKRRAWHSLDSDQKRAYLDAELCVMNKPATAGLPGTKTLFDELVSNHQILYRTIHATGAFLPYHRYLLHAHEIYLGKCGYNDGLPYWDEPRDAGNFTKSDIFDADLGFGSCDENGCSCVADGRFASVPVHIGPGNRLESRCLSRCVNNTLSEWSSQKKVDDCMAHERFVDAGPCFYMVPHRGGHGGVGGTMRDPLVSPSDPLFFMHHGWIDKLWFDWQNANPEKRMYEIGGPNNQEPSVGFPEVPGSMQEEDDQVFGHAPEELRRLADSGKRGDDGDEVTLNHMLTSLGIIPDVRVESMMDTRGEYLCYEYV